MSKQQTFEYVLLIIGLYFALLDHNIHQKYFLGNLEHSVHLMIGYVLIGYVVYKWITKSTK